MILENFVGNFPNVKNEINAKFNYSTVSIKKVYCSFSSENSSFYALKSVQGSDIKLMVSLQQEAEILSKLKHSNIIRLFDSYMGVNESFLILEWMETDLQKLINEKNEKNEVFPLEETENIVKNLFSALFYLRINRIFHADLKPSNILISNKIFKIADFGVSKDFKTLDENIYATYFIGTPNYWSPEFRKAFLSNKEKINYNVFKIDSFALALIILQIITLKAPSEIYCNLADVQKRKIFFKQIKNQMGSGYKEILKKMSEIDAEKRETVLTVFVNYSENYESLAKGILSEYINLTRKPVHQFKILSKYETQNTYITKLMNITCIMVEKHDVNEDMLFKILMINNFKTDYLIKYQYYDIKKMASEQYKIHLFGEIHQKISLFQILNQRKNQNILFSLKELINIIIFSSRTLIDMHNQNMQLNINMDLNHMFKEENSEQYYLLITDDQPKDHEIFNLGLILLSLSTLTVTERNSEEEKLYKELFFFNEQNIEFILKNYGENLMILLMEMIKFNDEKRITLSELSNKAENFFA